MPSTASLERDEEVARVARLHFEKRIFALCLAWFNETSSTVRRESRSRNVFAPYAQQLHDFSRQQALFREEHKQRRLLTQQETLDAMDVAMTHKYSVFLASYFTETSRIQFQVLKLPQIIRVGVEMLEEHARFRSRVVEEEHQVRYQLVLQSRVASKDSITATQRGDLERDELHFRDHILVEWDVETIARYREFRLEDSIFQLERFIIAQSAVRQAETAAREQLFRDESSSFYGLVVSPSTLHDFSEYHKSYLWDSLGSEYVATLFNEMMSINIRRLIKEEEHDRLYNLLVDEGNAFHRALDELQDAYLAFRRDQATRRLQHWRAFIIAKKVVRNRQRRVWRDIENRITVEDSECGNMVRQARYHATEDVIAPFVWTRVSVRNRHERHRVCMSKLVTPMCRAFEARRRLGVLLCEQKHINSIREREAALIATCFIQRVGRGCLAREEVCDMALEVSEEAVQQLQRLHIAALAIQWAYKEMQLRRRTQREIILAGEMRVKNAAAIKIQALVRRARVRDFYTLLLVPRHRNKTAMFMQRMLRGAQVRRLMHHQKLALMMQRFVYAFVGRRAVTEHRLAPFARTIQCMTRCTIARKRFTKLAVARNTRETFCAKNAYIVMVQALFRGYVVRKRNREAARIALQVRLTMLECDATYLEDDMWRVGRGFIARRHMFAQKQQRLRYLTQIQSCMRTSLSQNRRLGMEEIRVEELCRQITVYRVALVQGILQQRLSGRFVVAKLAERTEQDKSTRVFQALIGRCREGFRARLHVGEVFAQRQVAASRIHCLVGGFFSRRATCEQLVRHRATQRHMRFMVAVSRIQRAFRQHTERRRLAATVLQRSLVLRHWQRLIKKVEVNNERRKLYQLHRQSLVRYEQSQRHELSEAEIALRTLITSNINTAKWCSARDAYHRSLPAVEVPEHLKIRMHRKRLDIEEEAVTSLAVLKKQLHREQLIAQSLSSSRYFSKMFCRCDSAESVLRRRIELSQLECRRTIGVAFLARIGAMYKVRFDALERAENADRLHVSDEWQQEADVGLQKAHRALLGLLDRCTLDADNAAKPADDIIRTCVLSAESVVDVDAVARNEARASPPRVAPVSSLRRKFALPQDPDAPQTDITDDDLNKIFDRVLLLRRTESSTCGGKLARQSLSTARESTVAQCSDPQRPSSRSSLCKPRVLPPLESPGLSILHPQRSARSEQSLAYDSHLLREKAKDEILFTAEGIVDSSPLGPELSDETISVVESFLRSRIVTGLILPHATVSSRSILHILRVARAAKSPLAVIDVSQNAAMDDVVGNSLVDLVDLIPTLTEVKVAGTSICPAKRLLLFHSIERKKQAGGKSLDSHEHAISGEAPLAPVVRFARPLQLPRRNGWASHFKEYELEPKPGAADRIFERLSTAKSDSPQW